MCPIEKYISNTRNTSEAISRCFIERNAFSCAFSELFADFSGFAPFTEAP